MGTTPFGEVTGKESLEQVREQLGELLKTLDYLLNGNLDVKNIRARSVTADRLKAQTITAEEIAAQTITAGQIASETITAGQIAANTITADKMSVSQLSAITANLGHITAGLIEAVTIIGSLIKTSTGYPRCELNNTTHMFTAYFSEDVWVQIRPGTNESAQIVFSNNGNELTTTFYYNLLKYVGRVHSDGDYEIVAMGDIKSNPGPGYKHRFGSWSEVYSEGEAKSMREELDAINTFLSSLAARVTDLEARVTALESA